MAKTKATTVQSIIDSELKAISKSTNKTHKAIYQNLDSLKSHSEVIDQLFTNRANDRIKNQRIEAQRGIRTAKKMLKSTQEAYNSIIIQNNSINSNTAAVLLDNAKNWVGVIESKNKMNENLINEVNNIEAQFNDWIQELIMQVAKAWRNDENLNNALNFIVSVGLITLGVSGPLGALVGTLASIVLLASKVLSQLNISKQVAKRDSDALREEAALQMMNEVVKLCDCWELILSFRD